jgi:hypothetical protein
MSSPAPRTSLLDAAPGNLVLRILGTSHHGQVVRLHRPKCVIGSAPACTLRLRARGVRPVHCVILRGPAGTVIRRWSADTRLNGRAFTDARLSPGDRLDIGPIRLEVLDTGTGGSGPSWSPEARLDSRPIPREESAESAAEASRLDAERPEQAPARPSDAAPADARAVLSRLGLQLPEEGAGTDGPDGPAEPIRVAAASSRHTEGTWAGQGPMAPVVPNGMPAGGSASSCEEESIDEYMARLLERVRAGTAGSTTAEGSIEIPAETESGGPAPPEASEGVEPAAVSADRGSPLPIAPRVAAPEDSASIRAMRELANLSAWTAIDRHVRRRLLRSSGAKLFGVLLTLLCSGAMIWMWLYVGAGDLTLYSGLLGLAVALFWGAQYLILTGRLIFRRALRTQWKRCKRATDLPPPPDEKPGGRGSGQADAEGGERNER